MAISQFFGKTDAENKVALPILPKWWLLITSAVRLWIFTSKKSNAEISKQLNVSHWLVWNTTESYKELGTLADRYKIGRPRSIRNRRIIDRIRKKILRNPRRSIKKMVRELEISDGFVVRVVKKDLRIASYRIERAALLSSKQKQRWLKRRPALITRANMRTVFSD